MNRGSLDGKSTGNKNDLASKIAKWEKTNKCSTSLMTEIKSFLFPTKRTAGDSKPLLMDHYGSTFNNVDRWNNLRSNIKYQPRIITEDIRIMIGVIENALVQTWVLKTDWKVEDDLEKAKL